MRISKKQSMAAGVGIIILFFIIGSFSLRGGGAGPDDDASGSGASSTAAHGARAGAASPAPLDLASRFTLQDFHRSEIRDGKKVWEVKARRGQYFPETNSAALEEADLWLFKDAGEQTALHAAHARLVLSGAALAKAELSDAVTIDYNGKVTIQTDQATYDKSAETVHAPGKVRIESGGLEITGESLQGNITTREFHLERNVESVIKPKTR